MKTKLAGMGGAPAQTYVDDVFSTYLYTGNSSTQTIVNGIDLAGKGGLVWLKSRDAVGSHHWVDTARGTNTVIFSNGTNANTTVANSVTSFNANGFTMGGTAGVNNSPYNFASWTFRKAAKFFDVQTVTHTNGTANNINLSVLGTVGMVIAKITTTTGDWIVWHRSLTTGQNLRLNTVANASTTNAWLSVSGTTATLAAAAPTGTYVIYAYAHDASSTGFIQCGSFSGNYGAFTTVNLGWQPQYVFWKAVDNGGSNGNILDIMRAWTNNGDTGSDSTLKSNNSDAESAAEALGEPNASGFRINCQNFAGGAGSYVYMAIRMPNKPPTSGTQVFGLNARTGTGANATVTGGQTDDAVLIKNRGAAVADLFSSRLTGTGYLVTSSTAAEVAAGTIILQANPWDVMDGVKVGTTSTITNASANTFINYLFKRAPGFFDEVCYTGTGVNAQAYNHNLTVAPELIIVKKRSAAGSDWSVLFTPSTKSGTLTSGQFSTEVGYVFGNSITPTYIAPTTTTFTVALYGPVNASAQTFVAYLFATLAGISKVGSYTGNGTGQAIACGFSAGARFVLIKRTDASGDWYTFDSARGLTSGSSPYLLLNSTVAETTGNNGVYASTGGFTLGSTASTTTNISGASYIFLAVA